MENRAKIVNPQENAKNYGGAKELTGALSVIVATKRGLREAIILRFYMGRSNNASVVYASIWCRARTWENSCSGKGSAGGCGYHKESAAADEAISNAGIELQRRIDGVGSQAIDGALIAITRALGYRGQYYICRH